MSKEFQRKKSESTKRRMISLIQKECCHYSSGECNGIDTRCAQIERVKKYNEKKNADLFACQYFRSSVLPIDEDLESMLLIPQSLRKCERCNTLFSAGSNRAKYCSSCATVVKKKQKREYAHRRRANL
jgi:hypothetical protein